MNEPFWMLLPPSLRDRVISRADDRGLLPLNMTTPIMKRLRALPNRWRELWEMAERIFDHLEAELPGWGECAPGYGRGPLCRSLPRRYRCTRG